MAKSWSSTMYKLINLCKMLGVSEQNSKLGVNQNSVNAADKQSFKS